MFALPFALALTLALVAAPAFGSGEMPESDARAAIGAPGSPFWSDDAWLWTAFPPVVAGLARGGWTFAPEGPGTATFAGPEPRGGMWGVSWPDTLVAARAAAGAPLDGALVRFERTGAAAADRRARATFTYVNGEPAIEETALRFEQGDSALALRYDVWNGALEASAPYGLAGRHRWRARVASSRGAHGFDVTIGQAGYANRLASGEGEAIGTETGGLGYRFRRGSFAADARFERTVDQRSSDAPFFGRSRRDAQDTRGALGLSLARGAGQWTLATAWRRGLVRRTFDPAFSAASDAFEARAGWAGPAADGRLALDVALARESAIGRTLAVPSARFEFGGPGAGGAVGASRRLAPVWSDLADGDAPFLQDTWAASMSAHAGGAWGPHAAASAQLGRTRDRAIVARLPLDELWMRLGVARERGTSAFGLVTAELAWCAPAWEAGASGFGLSRDRSALQADVDPASGFRAWIEGRTRTFGGDLGLALRLAASGIGERAPEADPERRLAAYVTYDASLTLEIGDARIVIRGRELEDRPHAEVWTDLVTGEVARSPGRTLQTFIVWRFVN